MDLPPHHFATANARAAKRFAHETRAVAARYDRRTARLVITLDNGLELGLRPQDAQGLDNARPADLAVLEISPSGQGIHVPALDADLYVPGLLQGLFGSRAWMSRRAVERQAAAALGAAGGRARSEAKRRAAQENGRLGGRPRKVLTETPGTPMAMRAAALHEAIQGFDEEFIRSAEELRQTPQSQAQSQQGAEAKPQPPLNPAAPSR